MTLRSKLQVFLHFSFSNLVLWITESRTAATKTMQSSNLELMARVYVILTMWVVHL